MFRSWCSPVSRWSCYWHYSYVFSPIVVLPERCGAVCLACVHLTAQCDPATLALFSSEESLVNYEAKWLLTTIFLEYFQRKLQDFSLANQWVGYPAPRPLLSHMWTRSQVKKNKTTLKLDSRVILILHNKSMEFQPEINRPCASLLYD